MAFCRDGYIHIPISSCVCVSDRKVTETSGDTNYFMSELDLKPEDQDTGGRDTEDGDSVNSNKDSISLDSQLGEDLNDLVEELEDTLKGSNSPLFVHLMCSVHSQNLGMKTVPVSNLPVCFGKDIMVLKHLPFQPPAF